MEQTFRCTRNVVYRRGTEGHRNLRARQGYYIKAPNPEHAKLQMAIRFPEDLDGCPYPFTAEAWNG